MLPLGTSAVTWDWDYHHFESPTAEHDWVPLVDPLAHTLVAFPFVVRSLTRPYAASAAVRQAAAVLGANPLRSFARSTCRWLEGRCSSGDLRSLQYHW